MASKKRWDSRMSASRKLLPRSDRGRTNSRCSRGPAMQQGREPSPTRSKFVEGEESSFVATVGCPARRDVYQAYVYTPSQAVTFGSDNPYPGNPELEDAAFCRKCSSVDRPFAVVTSVRRTSEVCSSPEATVTLARGYSQKRTFGAIVIFARSRQWEAERSTVHGRPLGHRRIPRILRDNHG